MIKIGKNEGCNVKIKNVKYAKVIKCDLMNWF